MEANRKGTPATCFMQWDVCVCVCVCMCTRRNRIGNTSYVFHAVGHECMCVCACVCTRRNRKGNTCYVFHAVGHVCVREGRKIRDM